MPRTEHKAAVSERARDEGADAGVRASDKGQSGWLPQQRLHRTDLHRVMAEPLVLKARKASAELAENSTTHRFRESCEPTGQGLDLRMVVFLEFVEHGTGRVPSVSAELVVLNLATLKTFQLHLHIAEQRPHAIRSVALRLEAVRVSGRRIDIFHAFVFGADF